MSGDAVIRDNRLHRIRISRESHSLRWETSCDGKPLKGVRALSLHMNAEEFPLLAVELLPEGVDAEVDAQVMLIQPPNPISKRRVGIVFDGAIHRCESGKIEDPLEIPDGPVEGAFEYLKTLLDHGLTPVVLSTRLRYPDGGVAMVEWFSAHALDESVLRHIEFSAYVIDALMVIDVRAWTVTGSVDPLFPTVEMLTTFKPWPHGEHEPVAATEEQMDDGVGTFSMELDPKQPKHPPKCTECGAKMRKMRVVVDEEEPTICWICDCTPTSGCKREVGFGRGDVSINVAVPSDEPFPSKLPAGVFVGEKQVGNVRSLDQDRRAVLAVVTDEDFERQLQTGSAPHVEVREL